MARVCLSFEVRSIVGRFLEHGRVFYFENAEASPEVFLSSADLMPRNLRNRIEQCTPLRDSTLKQTVVDDLHRYLNDSENAWLLKHDGKYEKVKSPDTELFNAQNELLLLHSESY